MPAQYARALKFLPQAWRALKVLALMSLPLLEHMQAPASSRGDTNWGARDEEVTTDEKDKEDPKEKSEDGRITSYCGDLIFAVQRQS